MSFKTFQNYNDDNVVRIIEDAVETQGAVDKARGEIDRAMKKAVSIRVVDGGKSTRYEKLQNGKYFDWRNYGILTTEELCEILNLLPDNSWEAEYV
jgi:hypothetical protein